LWKDDVRRTNFNIFDAEEREARFVVDHTFDGVHICVAAAVIEQPTETERIVRSRRIQTVTTTQQHSKTAQHSAAHVVSGRDGREREQPTHHICLPLCSK
jgi:hypothetical protein